MKRFTQFDGHLWHCEGGCAVVMPVRVTADALRSKLALCPKCLDNPDRSVPILVDGFRGLGDTFYMKGPIRRLARTEGHVYFKTPWPQLFWDSPEIRLVNPGRIGLRTQDANSTKWGGSWEVSPAITRKVVMGYHYTGFEEGGSITKMMEKQAGVAGEVTAEDYQTKAHPEWVKGWMKKLPRPLGIVHPPSARREWTNTARAPKPCYLQTVVDARPDIFWVSVGWLADKEEWLIGNPIKRVQLCLDHGELSTEELLGLISLADVAATGPCFLVPAAMSLGTPLFAVFGGYAHPRTVLNPLFAGKVGYIAPDPICACLKDDHDCDKWIGGDRVGDAFSRFMEAKCAVR